MVLLEWPEKGLVLTLLDSNQRVSENYPHYLSSKIFGALGH